MSRVKLFETNQVRSEWSSERGLWYFSIVDVVAVLTSRAYSTWSLKFNTKFPVFP